VASALGGIVYLGQRITSDTVLENRPTTKVHKYTQESKKISWAREPISSGLIGRYIERKEESDSLGRISIRLSGSFVDLKYNLMSAYRVSPAAVRSLSAQLTEEVRSGQLAPEECIDILRVLETTVIARKKSIKNALLREKPVVGFVSPETALFFDRLKSLCVRMQPAQPAKTKDSKEDPEDFVLL
jgi:hypothetical protein